VATYWVCKMKHYPRVEKRQARVWTKKVPALVFPPSPTLARSVVDLCIQDRGLLMQVTRVGASVTKARQGIPTRLLETW
jgi:hypothetical protein